MSTETGGWRRPPDVSRPSAGKRCNIHELSYDGPAGAPCPACQLVYELQDTQQQLTQANAVRKKLVEENRMLKTIIDVKEAMTQAARVMELDDMLWVKEKLYEYKITKKLVLKTTHHMVGGKNHANGFIARSIGQEPEGYVCTSIGGAALAAAFDQACSLNGVANAMGLMCDALWELLPGGHR